MPALRESVHESTAGRRGGNFVISFVSCRVGGGFAQPATSEWRISQSLHPPYMTSDTIGIPPYFFAEMQYNPFVVGMYSDPFAIAAVPMISAFISLTATISALAPPTFRTVHIPASSNAYKWPSPAIGEAQNWPVPLPIRSDQTSRPFFRSTHTTIPARPIP